MTRTVLIADDHADIRKLIRMTLEFDDYEIHEVASGPQAVALAESVRPDLVLMDVMMPGEFDGIEACRRLRAANPGRMRLVMLSARGQSGDIDAGLAAGANAYLLKPFGPLQLLETIAAQWPCEEGVL